MPDTLTARALNRALLDRQLLLRREPLPGATGPRADRVIETVEHLVGLQAQAPFPPYYGLWSRLDGFRPCDLAELLLTRKVGRIGLMRGTIHLVSADECLRLRPVLQPVLERGLRANFGRQLTDVDRAELATAGRALVEDRPMTFSELGAAVAAVPAGRPRPGRPCAGAARSGAAPGGVGQGGPGGAHLGRGVARQAAGGVRGAG